jgi:sterol desaturase/sphingolipid hydroxylase (fatty acid hydroxylase superfamily)
MKAILIQHLDIVVLALSLLFFMFLERVIPQKKYKLSATKAIFLTWLIGYLLNYLIMLPLVIVLLVKLLANSKLMAFSHLNISVGLSLAVSLVILDLLTYTIHRLSHKIPVLWRLHKLHHSETELSTLTSLLHHPFELIVNSVWLLGFCMILGISIWAIVIYNILVIFHSAFCHANVSINQNISKKLSTFLVTPAFHRIHHSEDLSLGNSNYGELLTIWDFIFGSLNQEKLSYIPNFRYGIKEGVCKTVKEMLIFPFKQRKES